MFPLKQSTMIIVHWHGTVNGNYRLCKVIGVMQRSMNYIFNTV